MRTKEKEAAAKRAPLENVALKKQRQPIRRARDRGQVCAKRSDETADEREGHVQHVRDAGRERAGEGERDEPVDEV